MSIIEEVIAYIVRFHLSKNYSLFHLMRDLEYYQGSLRYSFIAKRLKRYEEDSIVGICLLALKLFYYYLQDKTLQERQMQIDKIKWLAETASKNINWEKKEKELINIKF